MEKELKAIKEMGEGVKKEQEKTWSEIEKNILAYLEFEPKHIHQIMEEINQSCPNNPIPIADLMKQLLSLKQRGYLMQTPNNCFYKKMF